MLQMKVPKFANSNNAIMVIYENVLRWNNNENMDFIKKS